MSCFLRRKCVKSVCKECGNEYASLDAMRSHVASVHNLRKCKQCGAGPFVGAVGLRLHKKREHTSEQPCPICGKVIKNPRQLKVHLLNKHTPESERPNKCSECDRRFACHSLMEKHRASVHFRDQRNLVCHYPGCDAAYIDYATRCKHEQMKHGQTYTQVRQMFVYLLKPKVLMSCFFLYDVGC